MKIVIIGSGNLATQLSLTLKDANHEIVQIFSRTEVHAQELAEKIGVPIPRRWMPSRLMPISISSL